MLDDFAGQHRVVVRVFGREAVFLGVEQIDETAEHFFPAHCDCFRVHAAERPEIGSANLFVTEHALQHRRHLHVRAQFEDTPGDARQRHHAQCSGDALDVDLAIGPCVFVRRVHAAEKCLDLIVATAWGFRGLRFGWNVAI